MYYCTVPRVTENIRHANLAANLQASIMCSVESITVLLYNTVPNAQLVRL